jgi:putative ABC transport system substrate-binding protein
LDGWRRFDPPWCRNRSGGSSQPFSRSDAGALQSAGAGAGDNRHIVAGIDRPGGDTTGIYVFAVDLGPKRLQILRELVPGAAVVGFLLNPNVESAEFQLKEIQAAASVIGQRIETFNASSEREMNLAFDAMARSGIGALLLGADPFFQVWRPQLIDLAQRHRISSNV